MTPEEINESHKRRWHEALVAQGLNANERTSYYRLDRETRNEIDETTRRLFASMSGTGDGEHHEPAPKRDANRTAFIAWMEANVDTMGTVAELAEAADVPQSAVRSVKDTHPAWFRLLGGHTYQIVNGARPEKNPNPTPKPMSDAAAEVARIMAQLEG